MLGVIGIKLLLHALHKNNLPFINGGEHVDVIELSTGVSLGIIIGVLTVTVLASLWRSHKDAAAADSTTSTAESTTSTTTTRKETIDG